MQPQAPYATHSLRNHPATPSHSPLQLDVHLSAAARKGCDGLLLTYVLLGDMTRVRIPALARPEPADGLWQHTCFEAFIGIAGETKYREFNFSPSGQWAAYHFSDQRQRDPRAEDAMSPWQPDIEREQTAERLALSAWLPVQSLPVLPGTQAWELGLTAVIESTDGLLSYWALQHPADRPDFHHRRGWQPSPVPHNLTQTVLQSP